MLINTFKLVKEFEIRVTSNNIIGFPTETKELIFDTINLNKELNADNVIVNLFSPYAGTKLREFAVKMGYMNENDISGDYRTTSILNQPHLSREELLGLHRTFVLYLPFRTLIRENLNLSQ